MNRLLPTAALAATLVATLTLAAGLALAVTAAPAAPATPATTTATTATTGTTGAMTAADNGVGTEQRPLAAFSKIELSVPYDVTVTAQGAPALTLSGPRKQFADIDTSVVGDTLIVRTRQHGWLNVHSGKTPPRPLIYITLPAL